MRKLLMTCTAAVFLLGACSKTNDTTNAANTTKPAASVGSSSTTSPPASSSISSPKSGSSGTTPGTASTDPAVAAFCQKIQAAGDPNPGIDKIFENNDNPTMTQWAAFLPEPIAKMKAWLGEVKKVSPPAALQAQYAVAVKAFQAEIDVLEASRTAAAAGDETAFKAAEDKNQNETTPALEAATGPIGEACGFPNS